MLQAFRTLFDGGEYGYGEWDPRKVTIGPDGEPTKPAKTIRGSVPLEAYKSHLAGEVGLGVVPVNKDGVCRFAAIDIDVDTIDHKALYDKVRRRKFPLSVCRSKSGGAHCYLFMQTPISAGQVQALLRRWAALLGYPSAEIFPKQSRIDSDNIGSWINLPYFGGNDTTRYAVSSSGSLSLEEFLVTVEYYDPANTRVDELVDAGTAQMPPCLQQLSANKLAEGGRNTVLFNAAVFYRKSQPANWENAVAEHNRDLFAKPLEYRELQATIKSAGRVKYQYTCEQTPLKDYCDRQACLKLPYGINHTPWQEPGSYDDLLVANLRKVNSEPPRYVVEVNGKDMELAADDFLSFNAFKRQVYLRHDLMVKPLKQPQWEQQIRELTRDRVIVEAPEDASTIGLILEKFHDFLALRERSVNREDILRGLPISVNDLILFRASDLRRHLQVFKLDSKMEMTELFMLLKRYGLSHKRIKVAGKLIVAWAFPVVDANNQTEDFTISDFVGDQGDEL